MIDSTTAPTSRIPYWMGAYDLYFVKGLLNDPVNSFFAYLFVASGSVASRTFGVFKMNFTALPYKYVYTGLSMSSGSDFSVNTFARTSLTDANDFLFAGKAKSLTDGTDTQTFPTSYGFVMKAKTSDSNINCFTFPIGYSLSLANTCSIDFGTIPTFNVTGVDGNGLPRIIPVL